MRILTLTFSIAIAFSACQNTPETKGSTAAAGEELSDAAVPNREVVGLSNDELRTGLEKGLMAYHAGDYVTAFRELYPLAEHGNSDAQAKIGQMYHSGSGIAQDYRKAIE